MKIVDSTTFGPFHHLKIFDVVDHLDNGKIFVPLKHFALKSYEVLSTKTSKSLTWMILKGLTKSKTMNNSRVLDAIASSDYGYAKAIFRP